MSAYFRKAVKDPACHRKVTGYVPVAGEEKAMVIRQQTGPWCMPHSLREIQSALRLCETRVNSHQDTDRTTVVIALILLLPSVKNYKEPDHPRR